MLPKIRHVRAIFEKIILCVTEGPLRYRRSDTTTGAAVESGTSSSQWESDRFRFGDPRAKRANFQLSCFISLP
jgi:hypothetical protein